MVNTTETYWDAQGVSLNNFAWSIETLGGMAIPTFRGEDILVPLRNGEVWVPKKFTSSTITLSMWIRGVPFNSGIGVVRETQQMYEERYNDLVRLLWTPGRQLALTKRFYDQGSLRIATAMAEFKGGLAPVKTGRTFGRCTVDLKIAEGLFFEQTYRTVPLVNGDNVITVPGNAPTTKIRVTANGARKNLRVRNKTLGVDFTYPRELLVGQTATFDIDEAEVTDSSLTYDPSAVVINSGDEQWLMLMPGENVINVSSTTGAGTVTLEYKGHGSNGQRRYQARDLPVRRSQGCFAQVDHPGASRAEIPRAGQGYRRR